MNTKDVLALAEQSRAYHQANVSLVFLVDFAKRVAAAEREECIKLCEAELAESDYAEAAGAYACVEAIRARGRE